MFGGVAIWLLPITLRITVAHRRLVVISCAPHLHEQILLEPACGYGGDVPHEVEGRVHLGQLAGGSCRDPSGSLEGACRLRQSLEVLADLDGQGAEKAPVEREDEQIRGGCVHDAQPYTGNAVFEHKNGYGLLEQA